MDEIRQAVDAVTSIWNEGIDFDSVRDPHTPRFASAALTELIRLRQATPKIFEDVLQGADLGASQLAVDDTHGLMEIVQNADDQQASLMRLGIRTVPEGTQLLVAHNGETIDIRDVIAMLFAFVSTKRDDPQAAGKFGVGLKTLSRIAYRIDVHCHPYHFSINGSEIAEIRPIDVQSFYESDSDDTMLVLWLRDGEYRDAVEQWALSWSAHDMLFLQSLKTFSWIRLEDGIPDFKRELHEPRDEGEISWRDGLKTRHIEVTRLVDDSEDQEWIRLDFETPAPARMERALKATGKTTTVSVALPSKQTDTVLYASLPTKISLSLPFAVGAAFDPNTARDRIQQTEWNGWLWQKVTELVSTVAAYLFEESPHDAWQLIPLTDETEVPVDSWVEQRLKDMSDAIRRKVTDEGQVILLDCGKSQLNRVSFENETLTDLFSADDFNVLAPEHHRLSQDARDARDRWRLVLEEFEIGKLLDVIDALNLLEVHGEQPIDREPAWYVRIVGEALRADLESELESYPCILVSDPPALSKPDSDGPFYCTEPVLDALAARLGLVRALHDSFTECGEDGKLITKWLEEIGKLWHEVDATTILEAIAHRGSAEPLELSDQDLLDLRDSVDELEEPDDDLLLRVGKSVLIDAFQFVDGGRDPGKELISAVYLPPSIAGGTEPWNKAAAETPGLKWAAPKYGTLLDPRDRQSGVSGARRTFRRLGAETKFRLEFQDGYKPIKGPVPTAQQVAFQKFPHAPEYLRHDYISSDLEAVVEDICMDTPAARFERGLALLDVLRRHWVRTLQHHLRCQVYYRYYQYRGLGGTLCTWISKLADSLWLQSDDGRPASPRELTVRSFLTESLFGDERSIFAAGVTDEFEPGLLAALGFQQRPSASQVVDILRGLRDSGERVEWGDVSRYYSFLSTLCPDPSDKITADTKIDDMTAGQLKGRFGIKSSAPGLIARNGSWLAPSAVFRGRPIFGSRRTSVPATKQFEQLWNVLAVRVPRVADCVNVLEEVAQDGDTPSRASILTDTYRHLNDILPSAKNKDRMLLSSVPLWSGSEWVTGRPIYYIADESAQRSLKSNHTVWEPPCSLEEMDDFIGALGVTLVPPESCAPAGISLEAISRGAKLKNEFREGVEALKSFLAKNHPGAYKNIELSWTALSNASLAVSPDLGLEISLLDGEQQLANTEAYLTPDPLTLYLSDEELLHDYDGGARVISYCFGTPENRQIVRLAWTLPEVMGVGQATSMSLAEDFADEENPLEGLKSSIGLKVGRFVKAGRPARKEKALGATKPPPTPRRLKSLENMAISEVEIVNPDSSPGKQHKKKKAPPPESQPDGPRVGERPQSGATPIAYTQSQKEQMALKVLATVVEDNKTELKDFTHIGGLGADAGDDLDRLFEVKAHGGEIPDSVTVQLSQVRAAKENPSDFYLAVLGGLEEGHETVVKLFARPLETLNLERGTSFKLSGIRSKQAVEIRF